MHYVAYVPADSALASRLAQDLAAAGYPSSSNPEQAALIIPILSTAALNNPTLLDTLYNALDRGLHIVPVLAEPVALPKVIDHLDALDFTTQNPIETLRAYIDSAASDEARLPLKVLTPRTRRANARNGLVIGALALLMFVLGIWGVGVLNIEAPVAEYNAVDTEVALTRDFIIAPTLESFLLFLPGSLEEAAVYSATVQAVPTRLRPFVAATATAVAEERGQ